MDAIVLGLVLAAAFLHASWNALVKVGGDPFIRLAIVNAVCGLSAVPLLPFVAVPAAEAWPYLLASVVTHHAYYVTLAYGYRYGDLSHVYPIARGVAPALVAVGAWAGAGENPGLLGLIAVFVISGAILSLAFTGGWRIAAPKPVLLALLTGVTIAAYTISDGLGGRASGEVLGYIAWLFVIDALPFTMLVAWRRRSDLAAALQRSWRPATLGGALSAVAYGLVIWAMSLTPMAHVSALRETSVIIAALIGTRLMHEPFGRRRVVAASFVAAGIVLLQASGAA